MKAGRTPSCRVVRHFMIGSGMAWRQERRPLLLSMGELYTAKVPVTSR